VTGCVGLYGSEMLRIPHCLDKRLTDGGEVVSLMHRPRSTPQKHFLFVFVTNICQWPSKPQGLVRLEGLGKLLNSITSSGLEPAVFQVVA
jgi:hypothetical protein